MMVPPPPCATIRRAAAWPHRNTDLIRAQHAVVVLLGEVEEVGVVGDPGVVDEDVEAPEGRDRAGDEPLA